MTFYDLLWLNVYILSSPGILSEPLYLKPKLSLTELHGFTLSTPSLVCFCFQSDTVIGEYYADVEAGCQVQQMLDENCLNPASHFKMFHVCSQLANGLAQRFSFLCPNGEQSIIHTDTSDVTAIKLKSRIRSISTLLTGPF